MQTQTVEMPTEEARALYRKYKQHKHYSTPIDRECMRAYQLLAQGRLVIKALASIATAGLNEKHLPKLAIAPADALDLECKMHANGSATMDSRKAKTWRRNSNDRQWQADRAFVQFPVGSFPRRASTEYGRTLVPGVPLHLRPRRGIANYHILWEAEWTKIPPVDPFLLRRIGAADLWVVCAMWDLTEVERGALSMRIS